MKGDVFNAAAALVVKVEELEQELRERRESAVCTQAGGWLESSSMAWWPERVHCVCAVERSG